MTDAPTLPNRDAMDRLRLRHLRLLALIAEHGSLSAAAALLKLSQPAATLMLRDLEAAFATPLIVRSAAGSTLTPAGKIALERLNLALGAVDRALESVAGDTVAPVIHIGMIPAVGVRTLPLLIQTLAAQGRLPRLVLHEATVPILVEKLVRGEIDCMIGRLDLEDSTIASELVIEALGPEQLRVACAVRHSLALKARVTRRDLLMSDWAVAGNGARTRSLFEAYFHDAGMAAPVPRIESFSFHTNLCVVAETELLTIAPAGAIAHYERKGLVRELALEHPFAIGHQLFVHRRDMAQPLLEPILEALREIQKERPDAWP